MPCFPSCSSILHTFPISVNISANPNLQSASPTPYHTIHYPSHLTSGITYIRLQQPFTHPLLPALPSYVACPSPPSNDSACSIILDLFDAFQRLNKSRPWYLNLQGEKRHPPHQPSRALCSFGPGPSPCIGGLRVTPSQPAAAMEVSGNIAEFVHRFQGLSALRDTQDALIKVALTLQTTLLDNPA